MKCKGRRGEMEMVIEKVSKCLIDIKCSHQTSKLVSLTRLRAIGKITLIHLSLAESRD